MMHEVAVATEILKMVNETVKKHNLQKVNKIIVKIGEFTCIEENTLIFAFKAISEETMSKDCKFQIQKIRARAYCKYCKYNFFISYTNKYCPRCNRQSLNITTGYELLLYRIEGE